MARSDMKRDYVVLAVATSLSLGVAIVALRLLEPRLFRVPADLKVVQLSKELPPFFEGVFRREDRDSAEVLVNDPITVVRGRPFFPERPALGPHDALGFRNRTIPVRADVVAIGDSQTYGNNAGVDDSWPRSLAQMLNPQHSVYAMAVPGWSVLQYLEMVRMAGVFKPRVVLVALYLGNDIAEAFRTAYSVDYWKDFRVDPSLAIESLPRHPFPPPPSDLVELPGPKRPVTFAPALRLRANRRSEPSTQAGLQIIHRAIAQMVQEARRNGSVVVLLRIPSKERVYASLLESSALPADYRQLVADETQNDADIADRAKAAGVTTIIDLLPALRAAVEQGQAIFPHRWDGHPLPQGYALIARTVAEEINPLLSLPVRDAGMNPLLSTTPR
jgi:hypothetical protein